MPYPCHSNSSNPSAVWGSVGLHRAFPVRASMVRDAHREHSAFKQQPRSRHPFLCGALHFQLKMDPTSLFTDREVKWTRNTHSEEHTLSATLGSSDVWSPSRSWLQNSCCPLKTLPPSIHGKFRQSECAGQASLEFSSRVSPGCSSLEWSP